MDGSSKYRNFSVFGKEKKFRDSILLKLLIGFGVALFFTLLFPGTESIEESRTAGAVWTDNTLYAPFSFPIYKDEHTYTIERNSSVQSVNPVVERRPEVAAAQADSLVRRIQQIKATADAYRNWRTGRGAADSTSFQQLSTSLGLQALNWDSVSQIAAGKEKLPRGLAVIQKELLADLSELYANGILDSGALKRQHRYLSVRRGSIEEPLPSEKVRSLPEAQIELRTRLYDRMGESVRAQLAFAVGSLVLVPNVRFDAGQTAREVQSALENVPRTLGYVQEGERIVGKNERISEDIKYRLDSYRRAKAERGSEVDARSQRFGVFFHVLLVLALYTTYLFLFRKKIIQNATHLALIAVIFCIVGLIAYVTRVLDLSFPAQYLILVPVASMLLAIIFDSRVAFYGTVTLGLLVAGIRGNDYAIMLSSVVAGALGAYTVRDIKNRTQIFRSLGFIFLGYAFAIVALGLERFEDFQTITIELVLAFTNALLSSVFTYAMLIFLERFFGVTTDLRLLELADFNQPLLQRLSEEAPGTFHHSVTLGNLAEAAADDIGANSILARVGAYYHDVGKLVKPEYFVENQVGQPSRHTKLKPRMSAKIIISHVTEGMQLARQYGVPEKVVDFIPQHHGTTRISFFLDKALRQAAARKNNKELVHEEDYRYPGPRPQTREAAIVMLADTVEASTRAQTDLTPQKLEAKIDSMIKQRFVEGELDECELTMRDLSKIREAFLQILIGIHHHRIQYPQDQPQTQVPVLDSVPRQAPRRARGGATAPLPQVLSETQSEPETYPAQTGAEQTNAPGGEDADLSAGGIAAIQEEIGPESGSNEGLDSETEGETAINVDSSAQTVQQPEDKSDAPSYDTYGEGIAKAGTPDETAAPDGSNASETFPDAAGKTPVPPKPLPDQGVNPPEYLP